MGKAVKNLDQFLTLDLDQFLTLATQILDQFLALYIYGNALVKIYIYICCGVIIWAKFGLWRCYYLGQVCFLQNTGCQKTL